jgi:hypothetical protein
MFMAALSSGKRPEKIEWQDYYATRWARMPSGSFVSQYEEDLKYKKQFKNSRNANKATVMASMDKRSLEFYLKRTPELYASVSTKYEWGKVRALYGCDITSFLMADFSMGTADECMPDYTPIGNASSEEKIATRIGAMKGGIPVCYDFDDFNSQHSFQHMQAVIKAYIRVFGPYLSAQQLQAAQWTMKSVDRQRVSNKTSNEEYTTRGTMFSGWRHTSFMNTVLNRVYLTKAGCKEHLLYTLHNGDDVFGVAEDMHSIMKLMRRADSAGLRAQKTKQNVGTIAEFLRMDLFSETPDQTQYLTRACATITHGRIETDEGKSLDDEIKSVEVRAKALIDRGGDAEYVKKLAERQYRTKCVMYDNEYEIVEHIRNHHKIQGGSSDDAPIRRTRLKREPTTTVNPDTRLTMNGVNDYLNKIATGLNIDIKDVDRDTKEAIASTAFKYTKYKIKLVTESRRDIVVGRLLYKSQKESFSVGHLSKARILGQHGMVALSRDKWALGRLISNSKDPMKYISYIT